MKQATFKKYLLRVVGALCILAAAATLFFPGWIQIDGIRRKDFRQLQEKLDTIITTEEQFLLNNLDYFEEDLKDNDLPYKKSGVKAWFRDRGALTKDAMDDKLSLKELTVLIWNAPGLMKDGENLLETDDVLDEVIAHAVSLDYPASEYTASSIRRYQKDLIGNLEDAAEHFGLISICCYAAMAISVLLGLLVVFAAAGHVCNKYRWGKFVLLAISLILAVGSYVGLPMVSSLLQDAFEGVKYLEDIRLRANLIPVISVALLVAPMVLDIVYNRMAKKSAPTQDASPDVSAFVEELAQN